MINITDYCVHQRLKKDCSECLIRELDLRLQDYERRIIELEKYVARDNLPKHRAQKKKEM